MSKFTAIQHQLEQASGRKATIAPVKPQPAAVAANEGGATTYKAPSREGKTHIGAYLHPDFKRSLRLVQAQTGEDVQSLMQRLSTTCFGRTMSP
jgi:hypothetical protein